MPKAEPRWGARKGEEMLNGEFVQSVERMAFQYNIDLLEGEAAMSESEMAELLEGKMGKQFFIPSNRTTGVDFKLIRQNKHRWISDPEPDMGTTLIHQFNIAAEAGDVVDMKAIRADFDALIDDSDVIEPVSQSVLAFMDREIARQKLDEVEIIREPQEPKAVPKCSIDGCFITSG